MYEIKATQDTWLKKRPIQSNLLEDDEKIFVQEGETYRYDELLSDGSDHFEFKLSYQSGDWFAFIYHWDVEFEPGEDDGAPALTPDAGDGYFINEKAWLDTIAYAEGTFGVGDNGYNQIFSYRTFSSYEDHPRIRIPIDSGNQYTTAAGRYQIIATTWDGLGLSEFTPVNQDTAGLRITEGRGALGDVREGNISSAINKTKDEWTSFKVKDEQDLINFFNQRVAYYKGEQEGDNPVRLEESPSTIVTSTSTPSTSTYTPNGGQITITINDVTFIFIQTGVTYKEEGRELEIIGQAETFKLTQKISNKSYTDVTLYQMFSDIAKRRGIRLDMIDDGVVYEFFPVRGVSLYKAVIREARRRGYRVVYSNGVLDVKKLADIPKAEISYVLANGVNAPLDIEFNHKAESQSSEGETASEPSDSNISGETRYVLDPITGNTSHSSEGKITDGSGDDVTEIEGSPLPKQKPVYYDETAYDEDAKARYDLTRQKGIKMSCTLPLDETTVLLMPNSVLRTTGFGRFESSPVEDVETDPLNRVWLLNSITHKVSPSGYTSSIQCSSPFKSKID